MAKNVCVTVSSEEDGTLRNSVPDRLVHLTLSWVDDAGTPHTHTGDYYLLVELSWLKTNHPAVAKDLLQRLVMDIARLRLGVDG